MIDHIVMRILDQFDMGEDLVERWNGKLRDRASSTQ
jgi:3-polyprenyl-4-hydroxybenzoate decarboxylase